MKNHPRDDEFLRYSAHEYSDNGPEINQTPPEFNEVRPDIHFFDEMPMADREHISGNGNPEEGDVPPKRKDRKKERQGFLQSLLKSVAKGAASAFATLALVSVVAQAVDPDGAIARKMAELLQNGMNRKVVHTQTAESFGGYVRLWKDEDNAPHDYDYDHPIIIQNATCTENGRYIMNCRQCDHVDSVIIYAKGHTPSAASEENRIEPTCTEDGSYDAVVICDVCGEELSREKITLAALGHTHGDTVEENRQEATCVRDGSYDLTVYCTVCGEVVERTTVVIPARGYHTASSAVEERRRAPTCTTNGSYDTVVYCSVCGEEISRRTVTVAATGHTQGQTREENRVEATCVEDGHYDQVVYCSVCGEEISRETTSIDATGHTPGEAADENMHEATCTEQGYYDSVVRCTVCDEIISSVRDYIEALGHTYTLVLYGDTPLTCDRCGEHALTINILNSYTVEYSIDPYLVQQAADEGYGSLQFDVVVFTDEAMTDWIGGYSEYITALSGTFNCDYGEREQTLYFGLTLRIESDTMSDDVIFVYPSQGKYIVYSP
ncbi:MAG: hypothetical protein IIZ48_05160 [Erysipelotrichales bacterium]|nr:hypothetical protein [Erysipelotrichales bacterium]